MLNLFTIAARPHFLKIVLMKFRLKIKMFVLKNEIEIVTSLNISVFYLILNYV